MMLSFSSLTLNINSSAFIYSTNDLLKTKFLDRELLYNMSAVRAVATSNTQILSSLQPPLHVAVAGGTSGIGRGIALAYRKHCPDAHVTIIGRNQSAADEILSQLGSNGNFIRADVSLMSEIRR